MNLLFLCCPVRLRRSLESSLSRKREEKATLHNDLDLKTIYRAELCYISAQVAVSSFTHLHFCDLKATQVNVAVSQAAFGLCNVVFGRSTHKKTHLMPVKPMTLLCFIYKTTSFRSFISSSRLVYSLSCALISHPSLSSVSF